MNSDVHNLAPEFYGKPTGHVNDIAVVGPDNARELPGLLL